MNVCQHLNKSTRLCDGYFETKKQERSKASRFQILAEIMNQSMTLLFFNETTLIFNERKICQKERNISTETIISEGAQPKCIYRIDDHCIREKQL